MIKIPFEVRSGRVIGICLFLIAGIVSHPAFSQNETAKITPGSAIGYYEYLPPDYHSNNNKYPLVIFLHGAGEKGNGTSDLPLVEKNGPPKSVKQGYQFPFILISPQLKSSYGDWPASYVDDVLEYVKTYLRVDLNRIYLTGLSLGGGGVWWYAQDPTLASKLAAIAPACGSRNSPNEACVIANASLAVWAFHGDADGAVNVSKSINMINAINACHPTPNPLAKLTIIPGGSHYDAWDDAYRTDHSRHNPNLFEWLMMQSKNSSPTITTNAGPDKNISLPTNSTTLNGSASANSGTISYKWTKVSGPSATLANTTSPTLTINNMVGGSYTYRLTATLSSGQSDHDDAVVIVSGTNHAPTASAGPDITVTLPTTSVNVTGSGSDSDGSIAGYSWTKVTGPSVTMTNTSSQTLKLSNLKEGVYKFGLHVTDDDGATGYDEMLVRVNAASNQPPVANAGNDINIALPTSSANIPGSGSDPDGTVTDFKWTKESGPSVTLQNTTSNTLKVSSLNIGIYKFRLTVTDNDGATAFDDMLLTVAASTNNAPSANAGSDKTVTLPTSSVVLNGSGTDSDGTITSYQWIKQSGPSAVTTVLKNDNTPTLTASSLIAGSYAFRLTVTDNSGATAWDVVVVTVKSDGSGAKTSTNKAPTADAGDDMNIHLPISSANIPGHGDDTDGTISGYKWSKITGPGLTMTNISSNVLKVSDLVEGVYKLELKVTDNDGATATDDMLLTVTSQSNILPTANAGPDKTLTFPASSVTLSGSGNDPDGTISSYEWIKQSGPSATPTKLSNASSPTLTASDLIPGSYAFRLTVKDNDGGTGSDVVIVEVNSLNGRSQMSQSGSNGNLNLDAGKDLIVQLPSNSATLSANANSIDGAITGYRWSQLGGPAVRIDPDTTQSVKLTRLIVGDYSFMVTAWDEKKNEATDYVNVTVLPQGEGISPSNMFSPNNDGQHDTWNIKNIQNTDGCSIIVYNRSGQRVYESHNYATEWNGEHNGEPLPAGVYYYVIECGTEKKSGSVTLMR